MKEETKLLWALVAVFAAAGVLMFGCAMLAALFVD